MAAATTLAAVEGMRIPWRSVLARELAPLVLPKQEMHWPVPRLIAKELTAHAATLEAPPPPKPPSTARARLEPSPRRAPAVARVDSHRRDGAHTARRHKEEPKFRASSPRTCAHRKLPVVSLSCLPGGEEQPGRELPQAPGMVDRLVLPCACDSSRYSVAAPGPDTMFGSPRT